mgnify:CR=1 FL=1
MLSTNTRHTFQELLTRGTAVGLTDAELLDRALSGRGDGPGFEALVLRHGPMVLRVCRDLLGDEHEAEDAFQATFLVLVRKGRSVRGDGSLGPWLHGVACRVAQQARVAAARRRRREGGQVSDLERPAQEMSVEGRFIQGEEWAELHRELSQLPEVFRSPLVLFHLQGLSHEEVALRLGCPIGTVRSRLVRGRERLRERLVRRGFGGAMTPLLAGLEGAVKAIAPSARLATNTAWAAARFATGSTINGVVSSSVVSLTKGTITAMNLFTLKVGLLGLVVTGALSAGSSALVARPGQGAGESVEKGQAVANGHEKGLQPPDTGRVQTVAGRRWLLDYHEGLAQACARKVPLFVHFRSGQDVDNLVLEQRVFLDPTVQDFLSRYVLVRLHVDRVPIMGLTEEESLKLVQNNQALMHEVAKVAGGTPVLVADPCDGNKRSVLSRMVTAQDLAALLGAHLDKVKEKEEPPAARASTLQSLRERLAFSERMFQKGYVPESQVLTAREALRKAEEGGERVSAVFPRTEVSEGPPAPTSAAEIGALIALARDRLKSMENIQQRGLVSDSGLLEARTSLKVLEAQLAGRMEQLRDEIEVLAVQREAREAELGLVGSQGAVGRAALARVSQLAKGNLVSSEEVTKAEAAVRVNEAELRIKQVAVKEVEVRIQQAKRRLQAFEKLTAD